MALDWYISIIDIIEIKSDEWNESVLCGDTLAKFEKRAVKQKSYTHIFFMGPR